MEDAFNIIDLFLDAADKRPEHTAIIDKSERITFGDLKKSVLATASYFHSKGIRAGDRVLVFVPMGIDLYRIVLALFYMGATAVFLDEWVNKKRLEACCEAAQCKALVGSWKVKWMALLSRPLRNLQVKLGLHLKNPDAPFVKCKTNKDDTALLTFTTGTTGTPKAAKRTHGFLKAQFDALIEKINPQLDDVDMPALPIVLLINLGIGCTSVIPDFNMRKLEKMNASLILKQIKDGGVNRMASSPFFIKKLAAHLIASGQTNNSIEKIFTGGAPVFPKEALLYTSAFSTANIEIVYGSTEAEPISAIEASALANFQQTLKDGLPVGKLYKKAQARIIKIEDKELIVDDISGLDKITLLPGQIGEIIVSGPHVLREYFNNDAALRRNKIFIGNECWHRTCDSGYFDENENLYLTGRMHTLIYRDEDIIAPFIYQNILQNINGVALATVVEKRGKIIAVAEIKKDIPTQQVQAAAAALNLIIDEIIIIEKMPRDPRHNSRIDYDKLKELI